MTRENALEDFRQGVKGDELIKTIYNDIDTRVCENCQFSKRSGGTSFECSKFINWYLPLCFGCTEFVRD